MQSQTDPLRLRAPNGPGPWWRASFIAAITVGLSAAGHLAAGGHLPTAPGLLFLVALATAAGYPLCRTGIARTAVVPLLALVQAALHPAFSFAASPPWDAAAGAATHSHDAAGSSLTMLVHHLVSGLVAAAVVVFTDRVLSELVADRGWLPVLAGPTPEPFVTAVLAATPVLRRQDRSADLVHQAPRRGPPAVRPIG